jgi:glycosyltransferase involved in cell wall biosynthesis
MIPDSILFITRNYPPKVGGLEKYSFNLIETFSSRMITHRISLSKSNKHLLWFFPYSLLKALLIIGKNSVSHVHLCDAMLAPVGFLLKIVTGSTVTATVHGLDITYDNPLYQKIVPWCLERLDRIVCVSRSTRQELLKRTRLPPENCVVISNGIMPDEMYLSLA